MSEDTLIRSYHPTDLEAIKAIHESSGIDYKFPSMEKFPVLKALKVEGTIRAAYGLKHTVEGYLWMDKSSWTDAEGKWLAVKALDREATAAARDLGIDSIMCCLPPDYERFGKRIKELGYSLGREGWQVFSKSTGDTQ
jgi:hypothetical protein